MFVDSAAFFVGEVIDAPAILDRLTVEGTRNDVNHVIAEHAGALEYGERVGANALNRRTSVELAVHLHDDFHIALRLRIRRDLIAEFDLLDAPNLFTRKPHLRSFAQPIDAR